MRIFILTSALSLALSGGALAAAMTNTAAPPAKPGLMARMAAMRAAKANKAAAAPTAAKPGAMAPSGAHKGGTPMAQRSAISISCSKQADAKGLHGKDREKFRRGCMKGG